MEQATMQRLKRTQIILLLAAAILLFFGGCGRQEDTSKVTDLEPKPVSVGSEDTEGRKETDGRETDGEGAGEGKETCDADGREQTDASGVDRRKETGGEGVITDEGEDAANAERMVQEALTLPLSNERVTVEYTGDIFMSSYRAMGADSIYLTGYHGEPTGTPENSDYFVGHMGIEDSEIQEFSPDIQEDMFALRACVDARGRCHLLFTRKTDNKVTYEDMEILVINQKGETEQRVDLSMYPEYEKMKAPWYWIVTDGSGTYYFGNPAKVLALDTNEGKVWLYQPEGETVEGLGIGKTGTVYGVFADENREAYLGKLHAAEGTVIRCAELPENNSRLSFSILQPGVNTELLLADKGAGIWSYDGQEVKLAIPLKDIIGNGQDILAMGFLGDGRCCIMSYENERYRFYYVPVEG